MEPELVHLIEVEPAVVHPDGRLAVHVECVGDPERRPQSAPYGWVRLMLRQDDEIRGVIDRQVTRDQWPAEANDFTIEIDLREQLPQVS